MISLTHSRFGGFLLHRGRFRSGLLTGTRAFLSTGYHAVSPRQDIHCADHIGVILIAAPHTGELGLAGAVLCGHIVAGGTRQARVVRWNRHQSSTRPVQFVFQLTAELEPALVENGFVESGLGPHVLARCLNTALARLGHVPYPQVLNTHHRVVLADRGRGLVQEVAPGIADSGMDGLYSPFRLVPVAAELHLAAHGPLITAQPRFVPSETVKGRDMAAIAQGGEASNA